MKFQKISQLLFVVILFSTKLFAQNKSSIEYINQYKDLAIKEMKRMGVPAAITLAQGLLETESGKSDLLRKSNNHFGIKCKSTWTGKGVTHDDDEIGECFRTYKDAEESYRDHSNFLRGSDRYSFLFKLSPTDYKGSARGLKQAGYATNPKYPDILIKHIEQYNLQQYSLEGAADVPLVNTDQYEDDVEIPIKDIIGEEDTEALKQYQKLTTINGTKCIWGLKGTSLLAIATQQNIQLATLMEYNDFMQDGILTKDQPIFLQKKNKIGNKPFCTTKGGETLQDIAQLNGIQLAALKDMNGAIGSEKLKAGTKIFLQPTTAITVSTLIPTKKEGTLIVANKIHEIKPKEGLYGIAKMYGVSMQQIKQLNNLQSDTLSIGQQLIIEK
jgi:LysM repeat protein